MLNHFSDRLIDMFYQVLLFEGKINAHKVPRLLNYFIVCMVS